MKNSGINLESSKIIHRKHFLSVSIENVKKKSMKICLSRHHETTKTTEFCLFFLLLSVNAFISIRITNLFPFAAVDRVIALQYVRG